MSEELTFCFCVALSCSFVGIYCVLLIARRAEILDIPSHRSSHSVPKPRGGGLGVQIGIGASAVAFLSLGHSIPGWPFWSGVGIMMITGIWDDIKGGLPVSMRLLAQSAAAVLIVVFSGRFETMPLPPLMDISLNWSGYILSIIWVVVVINFFNFMDGIDGIAGTQALITGISLSIVAPDEYRWLGLSIAGASVGFLVFNWQPAKIFLGDVGSYSMGFMLAASPFLKGGDEASLLAMLVGLSLWMFLADASFTFLKRLFSREKVWEAHRSHLYQRLVISGFSHANVTTLVGVGAITISAVAIFAYKKGETWMWWLAFAVALAISLSELVLTKYREKAFCQKEKSTDL